MDKKTNHDLTVAAISSGEISVPEPMVVSSAPLVTRRSSARKPTSKGRQRKRRKSRVDPQTLLSIAQSALARLSDAGFEVFVQACPRLEASEPDELVVVTIVGARLEAETKLIVPAKKELPHGLPA